jgi:hypothetical protein
MAEKEKSRASSGISYLSDQVVKRAKASPCVSGKSGQKSTHDNGMNGFG